MRFTGTAAMQLGETFERFLQQAPISVMYRALLERALDPRELDRLFEVIVGLDADRVP